MIAAILAAIWVSLIGLIFVIGRLGDRITVAIDRLTEAALSGEDE